MSGSMRVEVLKLYKRPAVWVLLAVTLVLSQVFNYLVPYAGYLSADNERAAQAILAGTLPQNLVSNSIAGFPLFAGALALTLGALSVGGEYGWGTLKTALIQNPGRLRLYAGAMSALAAAVLLIVAVIFTAGALTSYTIATSQSETIDWPSLLDLVKGIGAGWLILMMWCSLGVMLAFVFQSMALPIGLGIVWVLGVENLIVNVAAKLLDFAATLEKWLPGVNAGSLVAALGGTAGGTPGVNATVDGTHAVFVLVAYVIFFALVAAAVLQRRDVT